METVNPETIEIRKREQSKSPRCFPDMTVEQEMELWQEMAILMAWKIHLPQEAWPGMIAKAKRTMELRKAGRYEELNKMLEEG